MRRRVRKCRAIGCRDSHGREIDASGRVILRMVSHLQVLDQDGGPGLPGTEVWCHEQMARSSSPGFCGHLGSGGRHGGSLRRDEAIIRSWRRRARCHVSSNGELGRMVENRHPFTCTPSGSGDGVHRNALSHFDESARPDRRCRGTTDPGHEYCESTCWSSLARTAHRSDAHNTPRWATTNAYRVRARGYLRPTASWLRSTGRCG